MHIVFGARQVGKSFLLNRLMPPGSLTVDLADPRERTLLLSDPGEFIRRCEALPAKGRSPRWVFVDEAQAVPAVFDAVQHLFDRNKTRWRFVLCGSSARKLRKAGANLLPGRSLVHHLFPLVMAERPTLPMAEDNLSPFPLSSGRNEPERPFPAAGLMERLAFGELPGVVVAREKDKPDILRSYAALHLEEEIRREALVKDWGAFVRFLRLAAVESGHMLNFASLSKETGISLPTIKSYYQLLEEMFVGFRVPAFSKSPRKNLLSTPRFFFFDLGVRHGAAGFAPSKDAVMADPGPVFEQWVGIELWKRLQYSGQGSLHHFRSKDGAEIDFIVENKGRFTPIEVKWTERPSPSDARRLAGFLAEQGDRTSHGYLICRCPHPQRLHDKVTALPWQYL